MMSGALWDLYEGTLSDNKLVFTNLKSGTFFPVGDNVWRAFRLTMELTAPKRQMVIEKSDDGGQSWQPAFIAQYERVI